MGIPKLPKLFDPRGLPPVLAPLVSRVMEWASGTQDVIRALREFAEKTDFFNALRINGIAVQRIQPEDGQVLTVADGATKAVWETPEPGYTDEQAQDAVGSILTDTDSVALDYSDSGPSISATIVPCHLRFRVTAGYDWTSTTWTGVHNALTIIDEEQVGISRSNSTFTFTRTGRYHFAFQVWCSSTASQVYGWRLRRVGDGVVIASQDSVTTAATEFSHISMSWYVDVTASDQLVLEYAVSTSAAGSWFAHTVDGQILNTALLYIQKVE